MPIVNTSQARIELSAAQVNAFADIVRDPEFVMPPMMFIEETNLSNTVVVGGKGMPMTLIHHDGEVHKMGA